METVRADQFKRVCIVPSCESEELLEMTDASGSPSPALKCAKCGVVSTIFGTKL